MNERAAATSPALGADRFAISTLCWQRKPVQWGIARAAAMGFGWVDIGIIAGMTPIDVPQLAAEFDTLVPRWGEALTAHGVRVASFNARIAMDAGPGTARREADALCRAANALKAEAGVTLGNGPADDMQPTLDHLTPILEVFASYGQTLMVESHRHNWTERPEQTQRLLQALPGLKLTLDASHYIALGYAPADWEVLLPYVEHCHVRPAAPGSIYVKTDERDPRLDDWLRRMATSGYAGLFTFELIDDDGAYSEHETRRLSEALAEAGVVNLDRP